jgi:hypothetical protein
VIYPTWMRSSLSPSLSFIHRFGPTLASYRYRGALVAEALGVEMNDYSAEVLIYIKPNPDDLREIVERPFIADFCDDWFRYDWCREFAKKAARVTCPTPVMQQIISGIGVKANVIPDPYEFPEEDPHCGGDRLLWFGHSVNIKSLKRVWDGLQVRVVSNVEGAIPWSHETMLREFSQADIVLMPRTAEYKSHNRTLEAIRQGCFVVAEPHPALNLPGIWVGDIKEGIEWAKNHPKEANERTKIAQDYIRERFSPKTIAQAWLKEAKECRLVPIRT